jgi:peptidyl-tRNA hydrolase, PTH2 family
MTSTHDTPEAIQARAQQEDPIIQYYIVRKDLDMSVGKMCAQVAHAAQIFTISYQEMVKEIPLCPLGGEVLRRKEITEKWLAGSFRKVVLKAKKSEFEKIKKELDVFVVTDAGLTEVEAGSETVLVTWPMKKSEQHKILQQLRCLQ